MPEIFDLTKRSKLRIDFYFNPKDREWANYTIELSTRGDNFWGVVKDLSLLDREIQFLDIGYDNEILTLTKGFENIENRQILEYNFTPVDEKEFKIKLELSEDLSIVIFSYRNNHLKNNNIYKFLVEIKELKKFRTEIEQENNRLIEELDKLNWMEAHSS